MFSRMRLHALIGYLFALVLPQFALTSPPPNWYDCLAGQTCHWQLAPVSNNGDAQLTARWEITALNATIATGSQPVSASQPTTLALSLPPLNPGVQLAATLAIVITREDGQMLVSMNEALTLWGKPIWPLPDALQGKPLWVLTTEPQWPARLQAMGITVAILSPSDVGTVRGQTVLVADNNRLPADAPLWDWVAALWHQGNHLLLLPPAADSEWPLLHLLPPGSDLTRTLSWGRLEDRLATASAHPLAATPLLAPAHHITVEDAVCHNGSRCIVFSQSGNARWNWFRLTAATGYHLTYLGSNVQATWDNSPLPANLLLTALQPDKETLP